MSISHQALDALRRCVGANHIRLAIDDAGLKHYVVTDKTANYLRNAGIDACRFRSDGYEIPMDAAYTQELVFEGRLRGNKSLVRALEKVLEQVNTLAPAEGDFVEGQIAHFTAVAKKHAEDHRLRRASARVHAR